VNYGRVLGDDRRDLESRSAHPLQAVLLNILATHRAPDRWVDPELVGASSSACPLVERRDVGPRREAFAVARS
jgi:hypothetical protein